MKVLALGGSGVIGRHALRTLIEQEYCSHVVIADITPEISSVSGHVLATRTWEMPATQRIH